MFTDIAVRLRSLFRRTTVEMELDDELRFHFEQQVEKYVKSGLSHEKALRRARLEFGTLDNVKEECRDARGVSLIETLVQDSHYGLRMLRKNPGFTAIAILTLALGIGANTAIFSVVNAVLLQPLPFPEAGRLVTIYGTHSRLNENTRPLSYPDFVDLKNMNTVFEHVAAYQETNVALTTANGAFHLAAADVSADMFSVLHVAPALGRAFAPDEDRAGAFVVILSHQLWENQFHDDPGIIGHSVFHQRPQLHHRRRDAAGFHVPGRSQAACLVDHVCRALHTCRWAKAGFGRTWSAFSRCDRSSEARCHAQTG